MYSIQAAVLRGKSGPLKIESLKLEGPRDDEILVRLVASGSCHTDIDFCDDWDESDKAVVLGHEGAGVVEQVAKGVKGVKRGDHVVLSYQSCGHCPQCRRGSPAHCPHSFAANFGFQRMDGSNGSQRSGVRGHFFGQSSFATYCLATERNLVKVSKALPLEILVPLGCGLQTGAGTIVNSLKVPGGSSVAVFGTGSVGLAAVMAARLVGADPIIGVDRKPKRLKLARKLGATHVINSRRQDVASRIAIEVLNPGGFVAVFGGESGTDSLPEGRKTLGIIEGDAVPSVLSLN